MRAIHLLLVLSLCTLFPLLAESQVLHNDLYEMVRARVTEAGEAIPNPIPGTRVVGTSQEVSVEVLEGTLKGETISFVNDYVPVETNEVVFINHFQNVDGTSYYAIQDIDRRWSLLLLGGLFVIAIIAFAGVQGLRSLASLAGGLVVILYVLVPSLTTGAPPIPTSVAIASCILFFAIFFTHGFNRRSLIAFLGTCIAVCITGLLAYVSISGARLSGITSDESVYLQLSSGVTLDFAGLFLASVIIGTLGVLDDIAITQVAVVRELYATSSLTVWQAYQSALRVGKEHVSALVNTLVLAYTGTALPLLMLFSFSEYGPSLIVNREIFAAEIVRSFVGSIGLILTVPITTLLAAWFLRNTKETGDVPRHSHHH